jgi:glycosyltransferase involved in cell wall biosynthesis
MQDQGIRCLAETDDNYFADPNQNLFLRQNQYGEQERLAHARSFCVMDGIIFSTRALRDQYAKALRERLGKRHLPEMFVARNHVPGWAWPERVERDGPLRVGFMGSSSHVWDVNLAYPAFAAARENGCETVMIGYSPADPDPELPDTLEDGTTWRTPKSMEHKQLWAKVVTKHIRWVEPEAYHRAALPLDVGIAPLRSDGFTAGKSDVKMIEYAISGAAGVCANIPVYNTAGWRHNVNCLMANSPREYAEQTLRLIRDPKLRFELVSAAQEMIATERNESVMEREWRAALDG